MGQTGIPYCDTTWDLTIGCRKRSAGCGNCWAARTVHRLACKPVPGYGLQTRGINKVSAGPDWDWLDQPTVNLLDWNLDRPCHWRDPRFVFVNSKSDLFDERVPFEYIGYIFDIMNEARQHHYMVCTKEPGRMAEYIAWYQTTRSRKATGEPEWPRTFPHVILMTSIEGPQELHRWIKLSRIPAALRGVSLEPLLEPMGGCLAPWISQIDWLVIGCEKLPGGRAGRWSPHQHCMREEFWAEVDRLVDLCRVNTDTALWVKQGPGWPPRREGGLPVTANLAEFPESCRIQQRPRWTVNQNS
jgi:protein gp37